MKGVQVYGVKKHTREVLRRNLPQGMQPHSQQCFKILVSLQYHTQQLQEHRVYLKW